MLRSAMHIQSLRIFCDVARTRSFSRGASANGVSQSAASQAVLQLEKHLGLQLIDRSKRPLILTDAGQLFHRRCRALLEQYDALEDEVRTLGKATAGVVRVAAIYSVGLYHLAEFSRRFSQAHPDAQLRIDCLHPDRVYEAVLTEQANIGLVSYPRHEPQLATIDWREERMVVVCPVGHRLAGRETLDPEDLNNERFVAFDPELRIRGAIDEFLRRHQVHVEVAMAFDNIENIKQAISRHSALSILPEPTVRSEAAAGALHVCPLNGDGLVRPLAIIHRRGRHFAPPATGFLDMLLGRRDGENARSGAPASSSKEKVPS